MNLSILEEKVRRFHGGIHSGIEWLETDSVETFLPMYRKYLRTKGCGESKIESTVELFVEELSAASPSVFEHRDGVLRFAARFTNEHVLTGQEPIPARSLSAQEPDESAVNHSDLTEWYLTRLMRFRGSLSIAAWRVLRQSTRRLKAAGDPYAEILVRLEEKLGQLKGEDPLSAEVFLLRFFGGCDLETIARLQLRCAGEVENDWSEASTLLSRQVDTTRVDPEVERTHGNSRQELSRLSNALATFVVDEFGIDLVHLLKALDHLKAEDSELFRTIHLRFFEGYSFDEIGEQQNRPTRSVQRDWNSARDYLRGVAGA